MVRCAVSGLSWYDRSSAIVSGINVDTHRAQPLHVPYGHQRSSVSISGRLWSLLANISVYQRFKNSLTRGRPPLSPPAKALVEKGGQAGLGVRR
jgi:hypothetical protein